MTRIIEWRKRCPSEIPETGKCAGHLIAYSSAPPEARMRVINSQPDSLFGQVYEHRCSYCNYITWLKTTYPYEELKVEKAEVRWVD